MKGNSNKRTKDITKIAEKCLGSTVINIENYKSISKKHIVNHEIFNYLASAFVRDRNKPSKFIHVSSNRIFYQNTLSRFIIEKKKYPETNCFVFYNNKTSLGIIKVYLKDKYKVTDAYKTLQHDEPEAEVDNTKTMNSVYFASNKRPYVDFNPKYVIFLKRKDKRYDVIYSNRFYFLTTVTNMFPQSMYLKSDLVFINYPHTKNIVECFHPQIANFIMSKNVRYLYTKANIKHKKIYLRFSPYLCIFRTNANLYCCQYCSIYCKSKKDTSFIQCPIRKLCSACNLACYCSRKCQKKDWVTHKKECRKENTKEKIKPKVNFRSKFNTDHIKLYKKYPLMGLGGNGLPKYNL